MYSFEDISEIEIRKLKEDIEEDVYKTLDVFIKTFMEIKNDYNPSHWLLEIQWNASKVTYRLCYEEMN